jgi:hypothetical protein
MCRFLISLNNVENKRLCRLSLFYYKTGGQKRGWGGAKGWGKKFKSFRKQSVDVLHHFEFINKLIFENQCFLSQFFFHF